MKLIKILSAFLATAGVLLAGNAGRAQTVIANLNPSGAFQFQSSGTFTFTATAPAGITNINVQLTATKLTGGAASLSSLSGSLGVNNGLIVTGTATSNNVSAPLSSNVLYSATIQVTDANGNTASSNLSFDTIQPAYTFEAEDFDYSGGQFILDPQAVGGIPSQTNGYLHRVSVSGQDYVNSVSQGNQDYRPWGLETEALGTDKPRVQYSNGGQDYDVGWNNGGSGNWGNYTRVYPAGTYYVYVRGANGNGAATPYSADIAVVAGNAAFSGTGPFNFVFPNTGWTTYIWEPLVDANNNLAQVTFDGLTNTLRVTTDGGNYNANFYMLVPTNANPVVPSTVTLTNIYPDGVFQFEQTNTFVFTADSSAGITAGNIVVQLTGTNLIGQGSSVVLTAGNGLTITGASTEWNVSFSLATNMIYRAFVQVTDVNGGVTSTNVNFDTVSPNYYTFEAEDWDYNGGQFFAPPQTNAYYGANGESQVDYNCPAFTSAGNYVRVGLQTENLTPAAYQYRPPYFGTSDLGYFNYDVDSVNGGDWANYTRVYPAGAYNIYIRAVNGNNNNNSDSASLALVSPTAPSTSSQSLTREGAFAISYTGGWQSGWTWFPLRNSGGGLARVTFDGVSAYTLRATTDQGSYNADYYMLVPADNTIQQKPYISGFAPDGSTLFQTASALSFTANSQPGLATNNVVLNLNGINVAGLTFTAVPGAAGNWNVSYPVQPNIYYTAIVTLTDAYGTTMVTNTFGTFNATNYQFEAEDYDYNGGSFFDATSPPDSYANLGSISNIDNYQADLGANPFNYRASSALNPAPATTPSGDQARSQFTAVSGTDYNIGFFGIGSWANYTRHYPAGVYNVVGRFAEGAGTSGASLSRVTSGYGTTTQTTSLIGSFTIPNQGWGTWQWVTLLDTNGNLAQVTLDGSQTTLQLAGLNGNEVNVNFLMLTPANTTLPVISGFSPNGASLFQAANALNFSVASTAGIATNDVTVVLNGITISNLVFSGSATGWSVTYPDLQTNGAYTAVITVTSLNGETTSITNSFDTFNAADYQFEAEDYDFTSNGISGLFFDNPQVDSYAGLPGLSAVDLLESDVNGSGRGNSYRPAGYNNFPDTGAGDKSRSQFTTAGKTDYSVGSFGGGSWANYTRHYPPGTYNVIGRFAEGAGTAQFTLSQLTGGFGTTNQSASPLGTFTVPNAGWSTWQYATLLDGSGNAAKVTLDGSQITLQLAGQNNNEANVNFFLLAPTTPAPPLKAIVNGGNVNLWFFAQTGYNYQVQYKTNLLDSTWINLGAPISGNNTNNMVPDAATSATRFYRIHP